MKSPINRVWVGLLLGFLVSIHAYRDAAAQFTGDDVGIVSGVVEKADSERGLSVRSSPSTVGEPLAYLPLGTKVQGALQFKNGYVKLQAPQPGGWVPMDHLKPVGVEATVTRVDRPDLCLRIRSGPSAATDKVGCAELGRKLQLTGLWSTNNWAQVDQPSSGWVSASQIKSDLSPGVVGASSRGNAQVYYPTRRGKRVIYENDYYPWHRRHRTTGGGAHLHPKGKEKQ